MTFSRMTVAAIGDIAFGLMAYAFTGRYSMVEFALFLCAVLAVGLLFSGYATIAGSLAFFFGNSEYASAQLSMALVTFSLYPHGLFSGGARLFLYTLLPAMFVGAVPVAVVQTGNIWLLCGLWGVAAVVWAVATWVFYRGVQRYESGSAINVNM